MDSIIKFVKYISMMHIFAAIVILWAAFVILPFALQLVAMVTNLAYEVWKEIL